MTNLDVSPSIGPQGGTSRLGFAGVRLQIDARDLGRIENMFAVAPQIVAKHMRDVFGQFAGSHRKAVIAWLTPNYQRLARKSIFYRVRPKQAVQSSKAFGVVPLRTAARLEDIRMRIWATSQVTLLHETGGTINAKGKSMAIPVGGSEGNVRVRRARKPGENSQGRKAVSPAAMKAAGAKFIRRGKLLLQVVTGKTGKERLKLTHLLVRSVSIKPALGVIRTWESLAGDRQRRLDRSVNAMAAEIGRSAGRSIAGVIRAVS